MKSPLLTARFGMIGILTSTLVPALVQADTQGTTQSTSQSNSMSSSNSGQVLTEVSVRDLNKNPGKFAGGDVTIVGKITRIEGPGAFIVEGSGLLNNKILAVVEKSQQTETSGQQPGMTAPLIKEKEHVQLTGKVQEIGITKIEKSFSPLKSEIKAEFEGTMPVLVVPANGIKVLS